MSDLQRSKYEILDLIFTFLNALCMSLAAIFLLTNVTVISIFIVNVIILAFLFLILWINQNPFNLHLIRAFTFNNLFFTGIALLFYFSLLDALTYHPIGYILFLTPVFYLKFRRKSSFINTYSDNKEERIKRADLKGKRFKNNKYKIIIVSAIALTFNSLAALIYGFY